MRRSYNAAHVYMILGVVSGLFYRELTKAHGFTGKTQLSLVHTHLLALGMLGFLIVLALDKQLQLSTSKLFTYFFWFYNAGIAITATMMGIRGVATVLGHHLPEPLSWISGVGHIVLTVGLILLFVLLGKRLDEPAKPGTAESEPELGREAENEAGPRRG